jgi:uncharacterized membrane protein
MKLLLISNLLLLITFLFHFSKLPPQIPLFYSRPEGEEQLVDWWFIFLIPLTIIVFFFLNQYLKRFFKEAELIAKLIDYFNIIIVVLLTLIFIKIIFLIT